MALHPGTRIGPYEVTVLIGEGGMGKVYQATDTNLKRTVALKVLPDAVAADIDRLARFQREAEMLARLNHPNVAQIHGLERADGTTALVMELVEGPTLADRIASGPIPVDEATTIAKQIAEALEAAHERGIVHRDLKPANIKIRPDDTVKVLDFGLAKALDPVQGSGLSAQGELSNSPTITSPAHLRQGHGEAGTEVGVILGTAAYMSPEQARGKPIDKRTDIWAFGAVFYEMVTGRRAFAGDDVPSVLAAVLTQEPDWTALPPSLPPVLVTFIKRCLHKDRKQRLRDIGDVALALEHAFEPAATGGAVAPAVAPPFWKRALPMALTAIAAIAVTAVVARAVWPTEPPRPTARFEFVLPDNQQFGMTQRPVIAIAPDGHFFVYQTKAGLYLRQMNGLEPQLVPGTQDTPVNPIVSPDRQWIAYFTPTGQLKKIAVNGGAPITVCPAEQSLGASWSRDNTILFGQAAGIMRVSANGGTPTVVIPAGAGESIYGPELLADGDSVLFSVTKDLGPARWDNAQIVIQSLSSGKRTVLVEGGSDARSLPSGHLVYGARGGIFGIAFDIERQTTIGGAVPLMQNVQRTVSVRAAASHYAVSDDGTLVYVPASGSLNSLVWVDRNGASQPIASIPRGSYEDPHISPDASRVLVTRDGDIWIYELASGRTSRVTSDGTSLMGVWDSTGTRVAFSSAKGGNLEAWVASSDGTGQPRQLTRLGGQVHVDSWSPDGRTLTMHHHPANGSRTTMVMLSMDRDDSKPEPFVHGDVGGAEGAHFSPDGRHVSYMSTQSGQREIYIRPYPGPGGQVTVSVDGAQEAIWAKNNDVFYRNLTGDRMFATSITTAPSLKVGKPVQLFQRPYYMTPTGSPRPQYDVSADGRRLLMLLPGSATASSVASPRVIVVQNWFEEVKRLVPVN